MSKQNNFFQRALDAIIEGRTRQADRYVAQFERNHAPLPGKRQAR